METARYLLTLCLTLGILACAPASPPKSLAPDAPPAAQLPGATIATGPPLAVAYPATSLFPDGAVLPDAGGLDALEALAKWLKESPTSRWRIAAWLEDETPESLARAEMRLTLLQRFMTRKGLNPDLWTWEVGAPGGDQLRLVTLPGSP